MEIKNKSKNTTILMVMGFLFVAIAGVIFATSTWKYVPLVVKQIILATVVTGLYAISFKIKKLEKTKTILFYLATIFLGFFSYVLIYNVIYSFNSDMRNLKPFSLLFANIIVLIPSLMWFLKKRKGIDLFVNILLFNVLYVLIFRTFGMNDEIFAVGWAVFVVVFVFADYYKEKLIDSDNQSLKTGFKWCYRIFLGLYLFNLVPAIVFSVFNIAVQVLVLLLLTIATGISYKKNNGTIMRIINSMLIVISVIKCTDLFIQLFYSIDEVSDERIYIFSYALVCAIAICLVRKELFYMIFTYAIINTYNQLDVIECRENYIPCLIVFALYLTGLACYLYKTGKITKQYGMKMQIISCLNIVMTIIIYVSAINEDYINMSYHMYSCIVCITIGVLLTKKMGIKCLWYSFALVAGVLALMTQPILVPNEFRVEWSCFGIGIIIVGLRHIWYYKGRKIQITCFVLTSVLMSFLLLYNMILSDIENVMILGMTGIVMLLISAIKNNHKYVILSTIVLVLMVLYITMDLWLSIAWWVYLLIAGVVMIGVAVKKESEI